MDYTNKIAELSVDVTAVWRLQTKNLYSSTNLGALAVREMLQNSSDASVKQYQKCVKERSMGMRQTLNYPRIDIKVEGNTIEVTDNGVGMDVEQLHTKFLSLGGTSKSGESVGGFGVAKAVILGCGDSWEIYTQDNYLSSDMLGKQPVKKIADRNAESGTTIRVYNVQTGTNRTITDMGEKAFISVIREYVATSDLYPFMQVFINGEKVVPWFWDMRGRVQLPFTLGISNDCIPDDTKLTIKFYNNKEIHGDAPMGGEVRGYYAWVRLNGLTQFKSYIGWDCKCDAVIDFHTTLDPKDSRYPFGTSREHLKYQCEPILEKVTAELQNNPLKNAGDAEWDITQYSDIDTSMKEKRAVAQVLFSDDMYKTLQTLKQVVRGIDQRRLNEWQNVDQNVMIGTEYSDPAEPAYVQPIETQRDTMFDDDQSLTKELEYHGIQAKAQVRGASLLDQLSQLAEYQKEHGDDLSRVTGLSRTDVNANLVNPISYSWIIMESNLNQFKYKRLNRKWLPRLVVTWDTILRMLMLNFTSNEYKPRFDFYPGVVNSEAAGMCMERSDFGTGFNKLVYVMLNPYMTPALDDTSTALYLMNLGCHELGHFLAGCSEQHSERWASLREMMFNANIPYFQEFLHVVKASKLRLLIGKITGNTRRMPHTAPTVEMTDSNVRDADPRKAAMKKIPNERLEAFIYDNGERKDIDRLESYKESYKDNPRIYRMKLVMAYNSMASIIGFDIAELDGL